MTLPVPVCLLRALLPAALLIRWVLLSLPPSALSCFPPLPPLAVPRLPRLCPPSSVLPVCSELIHRRESATSVPRSTTIIHHHHPSLILELSVIHPTGQPWCPEPPLAHHLRLTAFLIPRDARRFTRALPHLTWPDRTRPDQIRPASPSASSVPDSQASFSRHQRRQAAFPPAINISPSANPALDVNCMPGRSSTSVLSCLPSVPRSS